MAGRRDSDTETHSLPDLRHSPDPSPSPLTRWCQKCQRTVLASEARSQVWADGSQLFCPLCGSGAYLFAYAGEPFTDTRTPPPRAWDSGAVAQALIALRALSPEQRAQALRGLGESGSDGAWLVREALAALWAAHDDG